MVISTTHINHIRKSLEATINGQHYGCCHEMSNDVISIKLMAEGTAEARRSILFQLKMSPQFFFPKSHSIVNNNTVTTFLLAVGYMKLAGNGIFNHQWHKEMDPGNQENVSCALIRHLLLSFSCPNLSLHYYTSHGPMIFVNYFYNQIVAIDSFYPAHPEIFPLGPCIF